MSQTAGFAFVEFSASDSGILIRQFEAMGFILVAKHKAKPVSLYRQGNIYFVLNESQNGFAAEFSGAHGPAACAAGFYVDNAAAIIGEASQKGIKISSVTPEFLSKPIPAIEGIGGSLIYLIDQASKADLFSHDFNFIPIQQNVGVGLQHVDHLSYNVVQGTLDRWADFYCSVFGFRIIRYFHIEGKQTALHSRALLSACETMRITINESADDKSQIAEFIEAYKGEGIQHIALHPKDIYDTVEQLKAQGMPFIPVPNSYYQAIESRLPGHGEDLARMQRNNILLDGVSENKEILLQIVTPPVVGPMFFEVIQRKGSSGFGEGNFTALFEALERDQVARGVLNAA